MEEDINVLQKDLQIKQLDNAISAAQQILDYESAHDLSLISALHIVQDFIKKYKRVCYGGTAMNMLLPDKYKFYNTETDLPDYDFLTPDANSDVDNLVKSLKDAGFKNTVHRVGMHEGTKKILVNYVAVADLTSTTREVYNVFYKESTLIDGIHYTNEHMLRMMMYLELSRPRGEVSRWKKVYTRLELLNKHFRFAPCKHKSPYTVPQYIRKELYKFILIRQKTLATLDLQALYSRSLKDKKVVYVLQKGGALVFYSSNLKEDAYDLKYLLNLPDFRAVYHPAKGSTLTPRVAIYNGNMLCALIIEEEACNSYNNILTEEQYILRISSLQTLITLYYTLHFFTDFGSATNTDILCSIKKCISTLDKIAISNKSQFPAFPIDCAGYQKGYQTLLHEKIQRIKMEKNKTRKNR